MIRSILLAALLAPALSSPNAAEGAPQDAPKQDPAAKGPIPIEAVKLDRPADFKIDVLPILRANCIACHNAKDAEGDVILESPKSALQGGENGPALVPGKADQSLILKVASHQKKPVMPPNNNKVGAKRLTPRELGLIKIWIDQGAKGDAAPRLEAPTFQPVAAGWNPIYAAALDPEGQVAACGRGGKLHLYHLASKTMETLADPKLKGLAHPDAVQAIAFSPDGALLATGGYRSIKIWKKEAPEKRLKLEGLDAVLVAAFSPDGAKIAAAGKEPVVRLFDAKTGKPAAELKGHEGAVTDLAFAPDGSKLLSASADKTVRIWKSDGAPLGRIDAGAEVAAADWTADGKVATGGKDGLVRLWPLPEAADKPVAAPAQSLKGHAAPIVDLRLAAGALLSASGDGRVLAWTGADKPARDLKHGAAIIGLAVSADGKRFATLGAAGDAKLWGPEGAKELAAVKTDGPARRADQKAAALAAFAAGEVKYREGVLKAGEDNKKKEEDEAKKAADASTAADKDAADKQAALDKAVKDREVAAKAADEAKAKQAAAANTPPPDDAARKAAEKKAVEAGKAADEAAAKAAAAAKALAAAKDDAEKEKLAKARKDADDAAAAAKKKSDDAKAALAAATQALEKAKKDFDAAKAAAEPALKEAEKKLADAKKAEETATGPANQSKQSAESAKRRAAKAKEAIATSEKTIQEAKGKLDAQKKDQEKADAAKKAAAEALAKAGRPVAAAAFSPDGSVLALGDEDGRVHLFGAEKGDDAGTVEAHAAPVRAFAGATVSLAADGSLRSGALAASWSLARTIEPADPAAAPVDRVTALSFSPDGALLASGGGLPSREGELVLWKVADGKPARAVADAHSDTIYAVAFSPDGTRLATTGADKFAKVFDPASGRLVRSFEGHTGHVLGVSWNRTGRTIATAGADGAVKVWDLTTGQQAKSIGGFEKQVTALRHLGFDDRLAVAAGGPQLRVVRENGTTEKNLEAGPAFLYAVAVSADGKLIAAGGLDGTLRLLRPEGTAVAVFPVPEAK